MRDLTTSYSLEELLKKKGIGPEGSKSLKGEELKLVTKHFADQSVSLTTKATMLTALLLLEPNEDEKEWVLAMLSQPQEYLPAELLPFVLDNTKDDFINLIKKIILKHDLNEEECITCMNALFSPSIPEYQKGPFLEAERLKRETFLENKTFFRYLWNHATRLQTSMPLLIDVCDSYDGCTRNLNLSVFVAALLSSAGFPTYLHAIDQVAPKEGVTSHQVLKAAGKNPFRSGAEVIADLQNPSIGWGYIDQSIYYPALYQLKKTRKEMVKRPFLATFEKLLQPIRAENGNLIFTGYTHPHYRTELVNQLASQHLCAQALVVKGAEGSTQLSLLKSTSAVYYDGTAVGEKTFLPEDFYRIVPEGNAVKALGADQAVIEGEAALSGGKNAAREIIIFTAMIVLDTFGLMNKQDSSARLEALLDSGKAFQHWKAGCN